MADTAALWLRRYSHCCKLGGIRRVHSSVTPSPRGPAVLHMVSAEVREPLGMPMRGLRRSVPSSCPMGRGASAASMLACGIEYGRGSDRCHKSLVKEP